MNTIADIISQWIDYRRELLAVKSIAPSTFKTQTQLATHLSNSLGSHAAGELRKSHIDLWAGRRLQTHKPVTVQSEIALLRQILRWAIDEKIMSELPRFPTVSAPNVEIALPQNSDFTWYLVNLAPIHSTALEFMLLTGLAPHELERLKVCDYDEGKDEIFIGHRADFFIKQPSRRRAIPLNNRARVIWNEASMGIADNKHPFPRSGAIQKAMRRLYLSRPDAPAGADRLTPKMMRKWFASVVSKEHAEEVLQRLMGHAPGSPITRRHYVRSTDADARAATENIGIPSPQSDEGKQLITSNRYMKREKNCE